MGKEWLALWEIRQLCSKTESEICDFVLNQGLRAYNYEKRYIAERYLYKWKHETEYYRSSITGAMNSRRRKINTGEKISQDQLLTFLGYFKFDDVMNFVMNNNLPHPNLTVALSIPASETSSNQGDKRREILLEGYEEANKIYEAVKKNTLPKKSKVFQSRAQGAYENCKFRLINLDMLGDEKLYDNRKHAKERFMGLLLVKILNVKGFNDNDYQAVYREAKALCEPDKDLLI